MSFNSGVAFGLPGGIRIGMLIDIEPLKRFA
jgi:hypothetical protein